MKERQGLTFDTTYTKVDINVIVDGLDIQQLSKGSHKATLKKNPKLFGGGLGKLDIEPVSKKMKEGSKPYQGRYYYYNIPKAYQ